MRVEIIVAQFKLAGAVLLGLVGRQRGVEALVGDRFDLLEQRVGGQLGGNLTQELGRRHLEDAERLAKLRRQDEALDLLLRLIDALVTHRAGLMKKGSEAICKGYRWPEALRPPPEPPPWLQQALRPARCARSTS
jgi:hypothetical protein